MKRVGYIYERICEIDNIKRAIMKSSKGKRDQPRVKRIISNIDFYAGEVQKLLIDKKYVPSPYTVKVIKDVANKKTRIIHKPKYYPDQIIHWALMLQLQPIIMRGMYKYSCGSVPGRGPSFGRKAVRKWLDTDTKNTKYCLTMDISQFYPSLKNEITQQKFDRKIKDNDCLWLIKVIIYSANVLTMGSYTSPWFSNFALQDLDYFIKQELKAVYYIRYVDDMNIFGRNKKELHKMARKIIEYLKENLGLDIKLNWQVFRCDYIDKNGKRRGRSLDFLGFRFFWDKTILRKRNSLRIRRRIKKISKKHWLNSKDASAVVSYWGWIKHSNSYRFYNSYVKPFASIRKAKKVVSWYARKANSVCANT